MNRRRGVNRGHRQGINGLSGKKILLFGAAAVGAGVIITVTFGGKDRVSAESTEQGIAYLENLEKTDTAPIEAEIKEIKKLERREALENGELSVWEQFSDSVILGDSRATGFSYWEFISEDRVMAYSGASLGKIEEKGYLEALKNLNPSNVFLCFGLNDISNGTWRDAKSCISDLEKNIAKIKGAVPECRILISSVLPVQEKALAKCQDWGKVPEINQAIRQFCEENDYGFIDNTDIVERFRDDYEADGIHMKMDFYQYWAVNMIAEVNEDDA